MRHTQDREFFRVFQFSETTHRPYFVILPVGLIHLVTDLIYFAIGLDLGFIAPDNFRNLLRVTCLQGTPTVSLRVRRYGGDQQNGNKYLHANGRVVRQRENQAARRQSITRAIHACCSTSRRSANGDQPWLRSAINTSAATPLSGTGRASLCWRGIRRFDVKLASRKFRGSPC